jgi:hypothetical protein
VPETAEHDISGVSDDVDVTVETTDDSGTIYDPDGNPFIMGNSNIALLEYPTYTNYWDSTTGKIETESSYWESRRSTYFQKLNDDCYYIKVKELAFFKIVVPTKTTMHYKLDEKPSETTNEGGWGAVFDANNIIYVNTGSSYKLNYTSHSNNADRDYVYVGQSKNDTLSDVTIYFYPNESIIVIEQNTEENNLLYNFQEYHYSSYNSGKHGYTTDPEYGLTYAGYSTTKPEETTD